MTNTWHLRARRLDYAHGLLIGVVNVTPDSFSDGGLRLETSAAIEGGRSLIDDGAHIVDVGGESTRPGSEGVSAAVELERVMPVVEALVAEGAVVSIDTSKPEVAQAALATGAEIVNDVTACSAPGMSELVAETGAGVILMHMKGTPRTMQVDPTYENVLAEVGGFLERRAESLVTSGVRREAIAIDPGIGFGKTVTHNLELIAGLDQLAASGYPVVLGASRKSFLGKLAGIERAVDRDGVSSVTTALGFERGARIFRVHDVASSRGALALAAAIVNPHQWDEWSQD